MLPKYIRLFYLYAYLLKKNGKKHCKFHAIKNIRELRHHNEATDPLSYYICRSNKLNGMKITLLTVGKTDREWVRQGLELYVARLKHYIPFALVEIPELKNVSALSKSQIKTKEGELILKNIRPEDDVILLDEHGRQYSSVEFAKVMQDKISYYGKDIIFIIGGAYGFSQEVYDRANSKISLSKMTFSHQMVRTIFAEQIYRAFTIIRGEPYHHE